MSLSTWVGCLALGALAVAGGNAPLPGNQPTTTLGDLQIAYNLECNARQHYLAYAAQADKEGYHKIACLMRAAARGEAIHAANEAADMVRMGGKPIAEITPVVMASLRADLRAAIAEESYERDHMYTQFSSQARDETKGEPQGTFNRARYAESTHAELFQEALTSFDNMKRAQPFYVCSGCGAVMKAVDCPKCIGCGAPAEKFEEIG